MAAITFTRVNDARYLAEIELEGDARIHIAKSAEGTLHFYCKDADATDYAPATNPGLFPFKGKIFDATIQIGVGPIKLQIISDTSVTQSIYRQEE